MKVGKRLGLALGGGAARGFAHIGFLQVLEEENIPISTIAGCSMGAMVGGLYASGSDMYILEKYARKFDMMKYMDLSVREGGFVRGKKIEELTRLLTKNISIQQTNLPFACVAVDICTGELKTFTSGPMYQAIRASISIPGVFTPYLIGENMYVDGGLLERIPIDAARDLGADVVVAVDVTERGQKRAYPRNIVDTLRATVAISDWYISSRREHRAEMLVVPDVYEIDPLSARDAEVCVKRGREAALSRLDEIKELIEWEK